MCSQFFGRAESLPVARFCLDVRWCGLHRRKHVQLVPRFFNASAVCSQVIDESLLTQRCRLQQLPACPGLRLIFASLGNYKEAIPAIRGQLL